MELLARHICSPGAVLMRWLSIVCALVLAGCSVIIAPYNNSQQQLVGAVGVIGPTRIDYARIIPMVDYTAKVIGRLIR